MTELSHGKGAGTPSRPRRPRVMRPYEWTHADGDFFEWLRRQGFSEDNWDPQAWAEHEAGSRGPRMR
jgi:hypothetical protein